MTRKDQMTIRFTAAIVALTAVEINLFVLMDGADRALAFAVLLGELIAIAGFAISFIKEDDREQQVLREQERRRNETD